MAAEPATVSSSRSDSGRWARSVFLAEASALLDASLGYEETIQSVARLAVPYLADWCVVDLVEDGEVRRVAVAHVDPAKEALAWGLDGHAPLAPDDPEGSSKAIRTSRSALRDALADELLAVETARDSARLRPLRELGAASAMVVPLRARNTTIGALTFAATDPARRYTTESLLLAEELARRCAIAIDNARLYRDAREAERRTAESLALLDTLFGSAPVGLAFLDRDLRYVRVNGRLADLDGVPAADHLGRRMDEVGEPQAARALAERAAEVVRTGRPITDHELTVERPDGELCHWTVSLYPVHEGGDAHGLGCVVSDVTERKRSEQERNTLLSQLAALARTDELTGLPNRRVWREELPREIARAEREGEPLCVAILDLDRFKQFNDTHGHQEGDTFLQEAATAWRRHLREVDLLARLGGEEFAVLLPHCSLEEAYGVLERVREATPRGESCSAGVALWDGRESAASLYGRADAALYAAKDAGRSRTERAA